MTDQEIWDRLHKDIVNPYGVAALMGNLYAESSMNPECVTGGGMKTKEEKEAYISKVMDGKITPYDFSHDGVAFGLVQWQYWSRKEALFKYIRSHHADLGSAEAQIEFMLTELPKYKTVWNVIHTAMTVKEASDIIMARYEQPVNMSDGAKERRAKYGEGYYERFGAQPLVLIEEPTDEEEEKEDILQEEPPAEKPVAPVKLVTITNDLNVRAGNGKQYDTIGRIPHIGTELEWVSASSNGWQAVVWNNRVGWVMSDFVKAKLV